MNNDEIWDDNLINVKKYIDTNQKLPSTYDKDKIFFHLGKFICHTKDKYKNNKLNEERKIKWKEFKIEYSKYL